MNKAEIKAGANFKTIATSLMSFIIIKLTG